MRTELLERATKFGMATALAAALVCFSLAMPVAANPDFVSAVAASHPIAYYRLETAQGKSQEGDSEYTSYGGVTIDEQGAPIGVGENHAVKLNGDDGYIVTTQAGGIGSAGTIMAWVKLANLPSEQGHAFYVAGESQRGNDFDIEFETDNSLYFYTAAGDKMAFAPPVGTLVGRWHMIVAAMDTSTLNRTLFWDGKLMNTQAGGAKPNKRSTFSIGGSTIFEGRYFHGGIDEVALWNRALKPFEVSALYAAASAKEH
jgi:hypothetical protein